MTESENATTAAATSLPAESDAASSRDTQDRHNAPVPWWKRLLGKG